MLVNVIVPRPWWNSLTYDLNTNENLPQIASRVLVPLGKSQCVGFVESFSESYKNNSFKIRPVSRILDDYKRIIPYDLWLLAKWLGNTYLCSTGLALKSVLHSQLFRNEVLALTPDPTNENDTPIILPKPEYFFCPNDNLRYEFFINQLHSTKKILLIFALKDDAANFYANLPDDLKSSSILWNSNWKTWLDVYNNNFRIVIGAQSAVYAPFKPDKIIVDDEANPSHSFLKTPTASARSVAGKRAALIQSELVIAGRLPSIKTYSKHKIIPDKNFFPDEKSFVIADCENSINENITGTDGNIILTHSLIQRTFDTLSQNKHVLWILNRFGEAAEISCLQCGESLKCEYCGSILRSEAESEKLRCVSCKKIYEFPSKCPNCGAFHESLTGRKPGLDALKIVAEKYFQNVVSGNSKKIKLDNTSLIIGTSSILKFCDSYDVGLAAWLDIDNELRMPRYNSNFELFRMIWDSFWRSNVKKNYKRIVLMQVKGKKSQNFALSFSKGNWDKLLDNEISLRKELSLPPFSFIIEIQCKDLIQKKSITSELENSGLFVMDSDEGNAPLSVCVKNLEAVRKILEKYSSVSYARKIPDVKVRAE